MPSPPFEPSTEAAMLPGHDTELADPTPGPITGERAVPSLANQWSHPTGDRWSYLPGENPLKWSHATGGRHRSTAYWNGSV